MVEIELFISTIDRLFYKCFLDLLTICYADLLSSNWFIAATVSIFVMYSMYPSQLEYIAALFCTVHYQLLYTVVQCTCNIGCPFLDQLRVMQHSEQLQVGLDSVFNDIPKP
jgi:hypothetical protein